jgi:hypothetical protein
MLSLKCYLDRGFIDFADWELRANKMNSKEIEMGRLDDV